MGRTIGYHLVKSGYGLWLPGDDRGSWSSAWDRRIGYVQPHTLHPADPVCRRMAEERMKSATSGPVRLSVRMIEVVIDTVGECKAKSPWSIAAASIEATHMHLLITYSGIDIHVTAKWLADQTTKAVHRNTAHRGPVWARGKWCSLIFDETRWQDTIAYIDRHNVRRGRGPRPYAFLHL